MNKEYTFDDWLSGKIGGPGRENEVSTLHYNYVTDQEGIPTEEFNKIRDAQMRAWKWAVDVLVNSYKENASKQSKNWKGLKIEEIKEFINENRDLHILWDEGKTDARFITGEVYKQFQKSYEKFKEGEGITATWVLVRTGNKKYKQSALQRMYVYKEYLSFLESGSNAEKLDVAADWMDGFVRKITRPELPTDDEIKQLFNEVYPGFKNEFDMSSLKTPKFAKGGKLKKTSISKALRFIFLEKHPEIKNITPDAIYRRYKDKKEYW